MRLERARQLLRETTLPVLDVAIATGFTSSSQFARAYRRSFGEPAEPHAAQRLSRLPPRARRGAIEQQFAFAALCVSAAARSNSARASSSRPSF